LAGLSADQQAALEDLRGRLEQGDVVQVDAFAVVGAPEATLLDDTRDAEEFARYRLTAVERRLESGLWAVITQTCDIRRDIDLEPFLHLSPIVGADEATWEGLRGGLASVRRFAYPRPIVDVEHPVLDVRIVQTVEKTALLAENVEPRDAGLDHAHRLRLSLWLARRFARHAFPDELEDLVLGRLRDELRKRAGQPGTPAGALLASRETVMVAYGEGATIDVLFLVRQDRVAANPVLATDPERKLRDGADAILRPVAKRLERQGSGYQLTWDVATPNMVPYSEILYRYVPFDVDVP
jgi:hypothetical protein